MMKNKINVFLRVLGIILIVYLLIPESFETTIESWKTWYASKLIRDSFIFPIFYHGPLYALGLIPFISLPFPFGMETEFLLTNSFLVICLGLLLIKRMPLWLTFLFLTPWVSQLSTVESTRYVFGMGLFALYLRDNSFLRKEEDVQLIPTTLLAATLCNMGNMFFLIGHICGVLFIWYRKKHVPSIKGYYKNFNFKKVFFVFLILLTITANIFQNPKKENNPFMMHSDYFPTNVQGFNAPFFQMGNWHYVRFENIDETSIDSDWYYTHKGAFGNSKSFTDAIQKYPKLIFKIVKFNLKSFKNIPTFYTLGSVNYPIVLRIIVTMLFFVLSVSLLIRYFKQRKYYLIVGILLGSLSVATAMLLTLPKDRFLLQFFPLGVLVIMELFDFSLLESTRKNMSLPPWLTKKSVATCVVFLLSLIHVFHFSNRYGDGFFTNLKYKFSSFESIPRGKDFISYNTSFNKIRELVPSKGKILSTGVFLFEIFSDIPRERLTQMIELPPFYVKNFFDNYSMIIMDRGYLKKSPNQATAINARYRLHVDPLLKSEEWTKIEVENLGIVLIRK